MFTKEASFLEALRPARSDLGALTSSPGTAIPVYAGHQLKADYGPSVVAKIRAARDLGARSSDVRPVLVWLDTDRVGADKLTAGVQPRGRGGTVHVRFASRRHDEQEIRFVPVDPANLREAMRRLLSWSRQHGREVAERAARLGAALVEAEPRTLADLSLAMTSFLVREHLGFDAPSALVSDLAEEGLMTEAIEETVSRIDDVISVFNQSVDALATADVDPQVQPLRPDYLPLHYSCDLDGRRCKLVHERRGPGHYAVTTCACGDRYEFRLGTESLSIADLAATGRWSVDVTLPIYLNDLVGGVVAGQSSALYGLVLNEVLEKVLGRTPVPMLVPEDLTTVLAGDPTIGLLSEYLGAR